MSEGQSVLIMSSWLWRAVMTISGATPLRGVEMCEVGILRELVFGFGLVERELVEQEYCLIGVLKSRVE
jgi:hypothetical protein